MREYWKTIDCSNRTYEHYSGKMISYPSRKYQFYAYEIDPTGEDREFVERTRDVEAHEFAKRMNPRDTAGNIRSWKVRLKDAYLGVLAEKLILKYLRTQFSQEADVTGDTFKTNDNYIYDDHVDIKIDWNNGKETTIEVRSSFAHGSLSYVVGNIFDHIGPYTTVYKLSETPKDYYLRGILYEGKKKNSFRDNRKHTLYFGGGVLSDWFQEIGQIKKGRNMRPVNLEEAERLLALGEETLYNTIPIPQGLDVTQIINQIRSAPKVV